MAVDVQAAPAVRYALGLQAAARVQARSVAMQRTLAEASLGAMARGIVEHQRRQQAAVVAAFSTGVRAAAVAEAHRMAMQHALAEVSLGAMVRGIVEQQRRRQAEAGAMVAAFSLGIRAAAQADAQRNAMQRAMAGYATTALVDAALDQRRLVLQLINALSPGLREVSRVNSQFATGTMPSVGASSSANAPIPTSGPALPALTPEDRVLVVCFLLACFFAGGVVGRCLVDPDFRTAASELAEVMMALLVPLVALHKASSRRPGQ